MSHVFIDDRLYYKVNGVINECSDLLETASFLLGVFLNKLLQRILEPGEGRDGPVERRDVQLVNDFGVRRGQAT